MLASGDECLPALENSCEQNDASVYWDRDDMSLTMDAALLASNMLVASRVLVLQLPWSKRSNSRPSDSQEQSGILVAYASFG